MSKLPWNDKKSYLIIIVLSVAVFTVFFSPVIRQDGIRYIAPARSLLIDGDLNTYNENAYYVKPGWNSVLQREIKGTERVMVKYVNSPDYTTRGYRHVVFPIGNALSWLPVLSLTHLVGKASNGFGGHFSMDGFSYPYVIALGWFSYLLGIIGMILAYRILRHFFSPGISIASLCFGVCAGNLIPFICIDVTFSHSLDFILINLVILLAIHVDSGTERQSRNHLCWLDLFWGLICGWLIIVRYQDVFLLLLPVVIYLTKLLPWKRSESIVMLKRLGWFSAACFVVLSLQLIYWKILYGTILISGSLMGTGSLPSFNPMQPEIIKMFFSKFHGLFSWMPILIPASLFAFLFTRRNRKIGTVFLIVMIIEVYYNASRTEWWNLGFSVRRFSGWSVFFMLGAAEFLVFLRGRRLRVIAGSMTACFIVWHWVFLIHFYMRGHAESIYHDMFSGIGPYGQTHFGIIWPNIKLLANSMDGLRIWFTEYSWLSHPMKILKFSDLSGICFYLLPHGVFLLVVLTCIWLSSNLKTLSFKYSALILLAFVIGSGCLLLSSDLSTVSVQPCKLVGGEMIKEADLVRINCDDRYQGENKFSDFQSLRFNSDNTDGHLPIKSNWIFGVPLGEIALRQVDVMILVSELSIGYECIKLEDNENCERLVKPWGDVPYSYQWYSLDLELTDHDQAYADTMIITSMESNMIKLAGMSYRVD